MAVAECTKTNIPARLDRLPWSRWHLLVVVALGVTWLLDGLEGNLAGSLAGVLKRPDTLNLSDAQLGLSATDYLVGSVLGALVFGYLTDRLGRKKLFSITLLLYLSATLATAFSWNFGSFTFFRALTGAGIDGEYAAVNSAVDELIPAAVRGHVDPLINSTFWIGAAVGSGASLVLLYGNLLPARLSWRFAFVIGATLGGIVLFMRRYVPESPRWLMIHGCEREAEAVVADIEVKTSGGQPQNLPPAERKIKIVTRDHTPLAEIWDAMVRQHCSRSGILLAITAWLPPRPAHNVYASALLERNFPRGLVGRQRGVSHSQPSFPAWDTRRGDLIFYAVGTLAGGAAGPALYGWIVGTGSRTMLSGATSPEPR